MTWLPCRPLLESYMVALNLMRALDVQGVQSVGLTSQKELLFVLDLVRIVVTSSARNSNSLLVKIKYEIVLSHD